MVIKITKDSVGSRLFTFCLNSFFVPFILFYILTGEHLISEIIVCSLLCAFNILISLRLINRSFSLYVDTNTNEVVLKRGLMIKKSPINHFLNFRIEYIGLYTSTVYKFYNLIFEGRKYRIRYYLSRGDNKSIINYVSIVKEIEQNIKREIIDSISK